MDDHVTGDEQRNGILPVARFGGLFHALEKNFSG